MKLQAIHKPTGKTLLVSAGNAPEGQFRKMVLANFPSMCPSEIVVVGTQTSALGSPRETSSPLVDQSEVVWRGSFLDLGGYANMNREICLRLPHHGLSVKIDVLPTGPQVDPMTRGLLGALQSTRLEDEAAATLVVGFTPMSVRPVAGRRTVFFTMMETQGLHREFVDRCNEGATEVWVPCDFYKEVFEEAGVARPIHVIPLGVNQNLYHPGAREPRLRYVEYPSGEEVSSLPEGFRFMSLFGWSYRKGPDVLCRAFLSEFDGAEDVSLVIYSRYMGSSARQHNDFIRDEIMGWYKEAGKALPPRIYHCGEEVPISKLPGCYSAADCFVFCSRGEGFGLPVIEAGACGTPVISAYHTAMTHYLDDEVAFLVEPDKYGPANDRLTWISGYYRDQSFACLEEHETRRFAALMREAHEDGGSASQRADAFRDRILSSYTWDACARRVAERLLV